MLVLGLVLVLGFWKSGTAEYDYEYEYEHEHEHDKYRVGNGEYL